MEFLIFVLSVLVIVGVIRLFREAIERKPYRIDTIYIVEKGRITKVRIDCELCEHVVYDGPAEYMPDHDHAANIGVKK